MTLTIYACLTATLVSSELLYIRIARRFSIVDRPNERSSHTGSTTVRGGGVLFWIAALAVFIHGNVDVPYFFGGLTLLALVSFLDDLRSLPKWYRLAIQGMAVTMLIHQSNETGPGFWLLGLFLIVGIGILNAYNFMDGINGMTAFHSLVTVGTLLYIQVEGLPKSAGDIELLSVTVLALLIFSYFNARPLAICFAGDVGSVSIAFIILFALLHLINDRQTYLPVLLLAVYGVDTVLTILRRLYLRENIFQSHRRHLFQRLVHEGNWSHLCVSGWYASVQLGINGLILGVLKRPQVVQLYLAIAIISVLTILYVCLGHWLTAKTHKEPS